MNIQIALLVVSLVCFIIGAAQVPWRVNMISLGLAFYVLSLLIK